MKKAFITPVLCLMLIVMHSCTNYGKEKTYKGVELYHKEDVSDAEAEKTGSYLAKSAFADGSEKSVQLTKADGIYHFRFVVKDGSDKDTALFKSMAFFASMVSTEVFDGAPLKLEMCDNHFNTLKTFESQNFGKEKVYDSVQLFHTKMITDSKADSLGNYLISSKFADCRPKTVQITKAGLNYKFRFVVRSGAEKDPETLKSVKSFANDLSANVFNGAPLDVQLCDKYFTTLATVPGEIK